MAKSVAGRTRLRSPRWLYKQCLYEMESRAGEQHLAKDILMKGIAQESSNRGHVDHLIGGVQEFFRAFPKHQRTVAHSAAGERYEIDRDPAMLKDWKSWLASAVESRLAQKWGYNYDRLRTVITPKFGGKPFRPGQKPGGRSDDEFKKLLRLIAVFWGRK